MGRCGSPGRPATAPPASRSRSTSLAPRVLFAVLLVLHVVPIWLVDYFPTQDGPLHVENVLALLRHGDSPLLQRWYVPNLGRAAELAHAGGVRRAPAGSRRRSWRRS